jgi:hypothetical protein
LHVCIRRGSGVSAALGLMQSVKQSNPVPGNVMCVYWQIRQMKSKETLINSELP